MKIHFMLFYVAAFSFGFPAVMRAAMSANMLCSDTTYDSAEIIICAGLGTTSGFLLEQIINERVPADSAVARLQLCTALSSAVLLGVLAVDQIYPQTLGRCVLSWVSRGDFLAFILGGGATFLLSYIHRLNQRHLQDRNSSSLDV